MQKKGYESELTRFIRDFIDRHPAVVEKQKKARATWWDRPQDIPQLEHDDQWKIPQTGYVYYDKPGIEVISGDLAPRDVSGDKDEG